MEHQPLALLVTFGPERPSFVSLSARSITILGKRSRRAGTGRAEDVLLCKHCSRVRKDPVPRSTPSKRVVSTSPPSRRCVRPTPPLSTGRRGKASSGVARMHSETQQNILEILPEIAGLSREGRRGVTEPPGLACAASGVPAHGNSDLRQDALDLVGPQ